MSTVSALMTFQRPQGTEVALLVHRGETVTEAEQQLLAFVGDLAAARPGGREYRPSE